MCFAVVSVSQGYGKKGNQHRVRKGERLLPFKKKEGGVKYSSCTVLPNISHHSTHRINIWAKYWKTWVEVLAVGGD